MTVSSILIVQNFDIKPKHSVPWTKSPNVYIINLNMQLAIDFEVSLYFILVIYNGVLTYTLINTEYDVI